MNWRSLILPLAAVAISGPLVAGFLGRLHPALDSFSHFRLHLAALLALVAVASLIGRQWLHGIVALLLAAGATVTTWMPGSLTTQAQAAATQPTYRLLQLNVHPRNRTPEAVLALIDKYRPDLILLQEASGLLDSAPNELNARYPYRIVCGFLPDAVIFSRFPLASGKTPTCYRNSLASATLNLDGVSLDVVSLHLTWPWPRRQSGNIEAVRPFLSALGRTAILAGDMNATPWSHAVRRVKDYAGMTRIETVGPTWLFRAWPNGLRRFGLPIDNVMSKGAIAIHEARTLEAVGSDHLPTLVEFSLGEDQVASAR